MGSWCSSGSSNTQTSTSTTALPSWLNDAGSNLVTDATKIAARPFAVYGGQRVAGLTNSENTGVADAMNANGAWQQPLSSAMSTFGRMASGTPTGVNWNPTASSTMTNLAQSGGVAPPPMVRAGSLPTTDLSGYMDPYLGATVGELQKQSALNQQGIASRATSEGAFGGSRSAVLSGMENQNLDRNVGLATEGAFTNAQGQAQTDLNRRLSADQGNQGATVDVNKANAANRLTASDMLTKLNQYDAQYGLAQGQQELAGAQGLQGAAQAGSGLTTSDISNLLTTGGLARSNYQSGLDTSYNDFMNQFNYPIQGVNLLSSAIHGVPYQTTTTNVSPGPNTFAQNLGGFGSLASGAGLLYNAFK